MDFWNSAKEKFAKTSSEVAKKTKNVTEITKMKNKISKADKEVKILYMEIGQYVYENLREDAPEEIAEKMALIEEKIAESAKLKAEIMKLKGFQLCPQCGEQVGATVAFCSFCGAKMPEPVVDIVDEGEVTEVEDVVEEVEEAAEEASETLAEAAEDIVEAVEDVIE